jgi:hypothetical protein
VPRHVTRLRAVELLGLVAQLLRPELELRPAGDGPDARGAPQELVGLGAEDSGFIELGDVHVERDREPGSRRGLREGASINLG